MEKFNLSELGRRIKAARKAKKKTQDDVAQAIGVSKNIVSEWERGLRQPGILNVLNYCNFLGMSFDELVGVKKTQTLHLEITEEERDTIFAMLEECQREAENSTLQSKLHFFEKHLKALFSRVQSK